MRSLRPGSCAMTRRSCATGTARTRPAEVATALRKARCPVSMPISPRNSERTIAGDDTRPGMAVTLDDVGRAREQDDQVVGLVAVSEQHIPGGHIAFAAVPAQYSKLGRIQDRRAPRRRDQEIIAVMTDPAQSSHTAPGTGAVCTLAHGNRFLSHATGDARHSSVRRSARAPPRKRPPGDEAIEEYKARSCSERPNRATALGARGPRASAVRQEGWRCNRVVLIRRVRPREAVGGGGDGTTAGGVRPASGTGRGAAPGQDHTDCPGSGGVAVAVGWESAGVGAGPSAAEAAAMFAASPS